MVGVLEQRATPASINSTGATVGPNGEVSIVVAEQDPGVPNWIPLRGYPKAQVAYRVLLAESEPQQARFIVTTPTARRVRATADDGVRSGRAHTK